MPQSQQGLLDQLHLFIHFSLDIRPELIVPVFNQSPLSVEHRYNQIEALHASKLFYIQCRRNNDTCSAFGTYDNTVLSAYTLTTFAVKIHVVVWVADVPELPQSQVCKITHCPISNYR